MKAPKRPAGPKETTPLRLRRGRPVRSLLLSLLLQRTPPAQAHTPVAHRRRRQLAQVQAPNPNLRLIPAPSARNGMAQIPKARLPPTSNPKAQRTPNAHSDKEPNQPRLRSEPRRARTLDRLATCHDRRGLRNRSHPAKHTATIRTCLHAGHVPRPIPQSYRAEEAAVRHNSLDPFRRKCIAGRLPRCKPGHPRLLQPLQLPRTPYSYCHPRLRQRDIFLGAELKEPGLEYQSRSFRCLPDAARVATQILAPPESGPLDPSSSGKKQPFPMTAEAPRLPDAIPLVRLGPPTTDLRW